MYSSIRNCFLIIFVFLFSSGVMAGKRDCLFLHLKSGGNLVFLLEEEPQIRFTENGFEIGLHSFQILEVVKYTFEDSEHLPEGTEGIIVESYVTVRNGIVMIKTKHGQDHVRLFTPTGQEIVNQPVYYSADNMIIDMNNLPSGVYLLNIGSETLKIMHAGQISGSFFHCFRVERLFMPHDILSVKYML